MLRLTASRNSARSQPLRTSDQEASIYRWIFWQRIYLLHQAPRLLLRVVRDLAHRRRLCLVV